MACVSSVHWYLPFFSSLLPDQSRVANRFLARLLLRTAFWIMNGLVIHSSQLISLAANPKSCPHVLNCGGVLHVKCFPVRHGLVVIAIVTSRPPLRLRHHARTLTNE